MHVNSPLGWPEGIEPSLVEPQSTVLPLNDGHPDKDFVMKFCDPGRNRTYGLLLRRQSLYPTELRGLY